MSESATPPAQTTQPAQPQIDVQAIANQAAEAAAAKATAVAQEMATRVTNERLAQAAAVLNPNLKPVDPGQRVLEDLVANPIATLHTVKELAKKEIREEFDKKQLVVDTQRSVLTPMISEYPELNSPNKLALVEKLAEKHQKSGKSMGEALKLASEEAIKEFGLKSVSEAQRDGTARFTGLPGGGGYVSSGSQKFDESKSQTDFISGMKKAAEAARSRRT